MRNEVLILITAIGLGAIAITLAPALARASARRPRLHPRMAMPHATITSHATK